MPSSSFWKALSIAASWTRAAPRMLFVCSGIWVTGGKIQYMQYWHDSNPPYSECKRWWTRNTIRTDPDIKSMVNNSKLLLKMVINNRIRGVPQASIQKNRPNIMDFQKGVGQLLRAVQRHRWAKKAVCLVEEAKRQKLTDSWKCRQPPDHKDFGILPLCVSIFEYFRIRPTVKFWKHLPPPYKTWPAVRLTVPL